MIKMIYRKITNIFLYFEMWKTNFIPILRI